MADAKISALSAVTSVASGDELVLARSSTTKKIDAKYLPGFEFDYAQITADVTVSATSAATANDVVSVGARVYDGSTIVMIEFFSPSVTAAAGVSAFVVLNLFDGSTDLGRIALSKNNDGGDQATPVLVRRRLTPSAASHTYNVKAWRVTANGTVAAGAGGTDTVLPAYLRVFKV